MAHVEIKARLAEAEWERMKQAAEALCGKSSAENMVVDTYYQTARMGQGSDQVLMKMRRFAEDSLSKPLPMPQAEHHAATGETMFPVGDAEAGAAGSLILYRRERMPEALPDTQLSVLSTLGPEHAVLTERMLNERLVPDVTIHKKRCLYEAQDPRTGLHTRIHFDEVDHLGHFVEIECKYHTPGQKEQAAQSVRSWMQRLGIEPGQVQAHGYAELMKDQMRHEHPELDFELTRNLSEPLRQELTRLPRVSYPAGTRLITEGPITDPDDKKAYLILKGKVGVYKNGRKLHEISSGQTVGEFYQLNHDARTADVVVLEPLEAIVIPDASLTRLYDHNDFTRQSLRRFFGSISAGHQALGRGNATSRG